MGGKENHDCKIEVLRYENYVRVLLVVSLKKILLIKFVCMNFRMSKLSLISFIIDCSSLSEEMLNWCV